ncbi:hypothetical protein EYC08_08710 [Tabrizicola sp. WMC-M-20]|nr:hypothetical protein EYC08_08710 [Tabrizicola sp. WMC-M-20]
MTGLGACADGDRAADVARMAGRLIGHDIHDICPAQRLCVPRSSCDVTAPRGDVLALCGLSGRRHAAQVCWSVQVLTAWCGTV